MTRYSFGARILTDDEEDSLFDAAERQALSMARWVPSERRFVEGVRWDDPEPESPAELENDRLRDA